MSIKYAVYSELYLLSSLLEIKKVCSISSALNAQFYLFIKSRVGSDEHIYQYPSLFIVGPKIWTANRENSYFCWSRKIWLFFLIVLFIDMKNYTILLFSVSLGKICCTKLDLLQIFENFMGSYSTCEYYRAPKGATRAWGLIPRQRISWFGCILIPNFWDSIDINSCRPCQCAYYILCLMFWYAPFLECNVNET